VKILYIPSAVYLSLGEMVGVDGETDLSEDQEAELSADLEVVIGKEEIEVGDEEVAGQGK
jgi:hypothetical protein